MPKGRVPTRSVQCVACTNWFETTSHRSRCCSDPCRVIANRKSWREYGERNRPVRQIYQRQLYDRQPEKVTARVMAYRETEAGKRVGAKAGAYQREVPLEKRRARAAVNKAVKAGKLTRAPCETCGAEKTQGHHEDYSRPLDVRWLCARCHGLEHRKPRALEVPFERPHHVRNDGPAPLTTAPAADPGDVV